MDQEKPRKSKLRHLRYLLYLVPILAIVIGYGGVILADGRILPFYNCTWSQYGTRRFCQALLRSLTKCLSRVFSGRYHRLYSPDSTAAVLRQRPGTTRSYSETSDPCFVIHRIVNIHDYPNGTRIVTTKGDNNGGSISFPPIDVDINSSMYIGKVVMQ